MKANLEQLTEEVKLLKLSIISLKYSLGKCQKIDIAKEVSFDEMDSIYAFIARFGRTSDFYTQKVIRTIFTLEREPLYTFVDIMNSSEKFGIINSAENMIYIRDLRNQIAHEYIPV